MAFRLPYTIGCDQPGCDAEVTVQATSQPDAIRVLEREKTGLEAWSTQIHYSSGLDSLIDGGREIIGYSMFCPAHYHPEDRK